MDGVAHVPPNGLCSQNGWPNGPYHFDVAVPPSTPFGLGVWSVDCGYGPGIAHFSNLTFEIVTQVDLPGAIDPRNYWDVATSQPGNTSLALAGDFDSDGVQDIALGLPSSGQSPGRVEVRSGFDGPLLFERIGAPSFGGAVAGVGDLTGDGVPDLLIGAPDESSPAGVANAGWAFLVSGSTGQDVFSLHGNADTRHLGFAVAGCNDLDGDGVGELLIGAPGLGLVLGSKAKVLVVSGATGATLRVLNSPSDALRFGWSIVALDLDGDGLDDQVVGAPPASPGPSAKGQVVAHSGADGAVLWWAEGLGNLGRSLAAAGDLMGGPQPDVLAGAPSAQGDGVAVGQIQLLDGASGVTLHTVSGLEQGGQFGHSLGWAGDVDGDGISELAVAAPGSLTTFLLSWPSGALVNQLDTGPGPTGALLTTPGDLDGDGQADLVTAWGPTVHAWHGLQRPGAPTLDVTGELLPDTKLHVLVGQVPQALPVALIVGGSPLGLPFHGSVLVPSPDFVVPLVVDASGSATLSLRWPAPTSTWWAAWLQL